MRGLFVLAGAALIIAAPGHAGDVKELACAEQAYTPEQRAQIDGLLPQIDLLSGGDNPALNQLGALVGSTAMQCGDQLQWEQADLQPAILFELGRLMEIGMRRHGPLTPAEIAKVEAALAKGDRTKLWTAIEEQVMIGMTGGDATVSNDNAVVFGAFMVETGLGLDVTKAEYVGAFLATKAMQRTSMRTFTAQ
ncbi:hypothetical protein [Erythrobacter donghaensis]|uniref:hypothetical protein n=1 Tax=Erythrobacter donghaensis TaxID=267135 RepID=UPI000A399C48|nr:hypothetical protein [Erythrobacter donghaensis]